MRISARPNGITNKFGWLQPPATTNYSASISFEYPATIRIDKIFMLAVRRVELSADSLGRSSIH
jgi:hypothetical protein